MEIFGKWRDAAVVSKKWRKFYNVERAHSSFGHQTPNEFKLDWKAAEIIEKRNEEESCQPNGSRFGVLTGE